VWLFQQQESAFHDDVPSQNLSLSKKEMGKQHKVHASAAQN
jgi:hypothetical protein